MMFRHNSSGEQQRHRVRSRMLAAAALLAEASGAPRCRPLRAGCPSGGDPSGGGNLVGAAGLSGFGTSRCGRPPGRGRWLRGGGRRPGRHGHERRGPRWWLSIWITFYNSGQCRGGEGTILTGYGYRGVSA